MEKAGTKRRDIHFRSDKNGIVVCVHSREAREYARYLEASADVASYESEKNTLTLSGRQIL